jgi:Na+/H+ antiporter NhaA
MSLFIGSLAVSDVERETMTKLAVLAGSLFSALVGAAVLLPARRSARPSVPRSR